MPSCRCMRRCGRAHGDLQPVLGLQNVGVTIGPRAYAFSVRTANLPTSGAGIYFIDCPELYDRRSLYTTDPDEHRRFLLFTHAAVESCLRLGFAPDVFPLSTTGMPRSCRCT